jgi:hypothetical protein
MRCACEGAREDQRLHFRSRGVVIYENACGLSSYVCELFHYAREPQLHVSLPPRARQQRDGARLDDDDAQRHGGERRLSDDAPAPDASVLLPSWSFSLFATDGSRSRRVVGCPWSELRGYHRPSNGRFEAHLQTCVMQYKDYLPRTSTVETKKPRCGLPPEAPFFAPLTLFSLRGPVGSFLAAFLEELQVYLLEPCGNMQYFC